LLEKDILFAADHPFLVGMEFLFQSELRLYFVMPFIQGGELYKIFQSKKRFSEETVRFYGAQIALAIGELHSKGIMHRDLKLENILVDNKGYLKIIDYGLAKVLKTDELAQSYCGTPEYLAPEMVDYSGHDSCVDWWALGILMYEMLIGVTPFFNRQRQVLVNKIKNSKIIFPDRAHYKIEYSDELVDLISLLLKKDRKARLGFKDGVNEVMAHPFFASTIKVDLE
jgi:serum/glucocorticoid-regulated kinase 2